MHVDGHALWVDKILSVANAKVKVQRVDCTPPKKRGFQVVVMVYSGPWAWLRMRVERVAGPGVVVDVKVQDKSGAWLQMENKWGAVWEVNNSPKTSRMRFQVTTDDNQRRTSRWLQLTPGMKEKRFWQGNKQFRAVRLKAVRTTPTGPPVYQQCIVVQVDGNSCANQKSWGKCNLSWMTAATANKYGYCAKTCGRCSSAGRKLLMAGGMGNGTEPQLPGASGTAEGDGGGWSVEGGAAELSGFAPGGLQAQGGAQ